MRFANNIPAIIVFWLLLPKDFPVGLHVATKRLSTFCPVSPTVNITLIRTTFRYIINVAHTTKQKLKFRHELTRGGHIFYMEIDGYATHNPEAIMTVVDLMDKYNMGYTSVNHNRNRCMNCGYENAASQMNECPQCGSCHIDRLQRITGYLVGTTDR
jgi:ssDNA-binding Zn-finger/Zn-ribbon topoisomerase 1